MNPQVSVVIPTYNRRRMLRDAVSSVMAQRDVSFELIIVDDGSTDGTWEDLHRGELEQVIAAAPCDCRVDAVRTARRGPAAARNCGAAVARGEYLAFLDSDDLWAPQKAGRQLAYMQAHPEFPLSQTQECWIRGGRRINPGLRHKKQAGDIFEPSLRTCLVSPSAVMMRTELFHEMGGFDEVLPACEDYDLWLRILCRYQVGLLDEPLVTRRAGHPDQLSATVAALDRYRIRALVKLLAGSELAVSRRLAVAKVIAEKCAIYAKGLSRRGRQDEFNFYSSLGQSARALLDNQADPAAGYWIAALKDQPVDIDQA
ncbi:MAG TPA: glycosyltransferase family A protein [Candidatus Binataceae bacterium]|jgi:glycosyltransferase involved in cell wall biosynthesis|nr:glycosyltransferase family A protein [Candidatus Binataceae bacterium]